MSRGDNRSRGKAKPKARKVQPTQERSARARRTREPIGRKWFAQCILRLPAPGRQRRHLRCVLLLAASQLFSLQVPARRGSARRGCGPAQGHRRREGRARRIVDRNDDKLAFTIEARALTFQPVKIRKQLADAKAKTPEAPDPPRRLRDIATEVASRL